MGTKRHLVPDIEQVVERCQPGPVLDLFAGMSSVAFGLPKERQVWTNDIQYFSSEVSYAHFVSQTLPMRYDIAAELIGPRFSRIKEQKIKSAKFVSDEEYALENGDYSKLSELFSEKIRLANNSSGSSSKDHYSLFATLYGGVYVSERQGIEIDSLRQVFDELLGSQEICKDTHRWFLLALATALARVANVTGHFAQALRPKPSNFSRTVTQRGKSIYPIWLDALSDLAPKGTKLWRKGNKVFRENANSLLSRLSQKGRELPTVIYADPPYTSDQYSRYYHLYETLILYDWPVAHGNGLYRGDRYSSEYSLRSKSISALEDLFQSAAKLGSDLIISYPKNGLIEDSQSQITDFAVKYFSCLPEITKIPHHHSTMGASKGSSKMEVEETIYRIAA